MLIIGGTLACGDPSEGAPSRDASTDSGIGPGDARSSGSPDAADGPLPVPFSVEMIVVGPCSTQCGTLSRACVDECFDDGAWGDMATYGTGAIKSECREGARTE